MSARDRDWTWEHSMVLAFFALLLNGCVCLALVGLESLGERVSAELDSVTPPGERERVRPPAKPFRDPRPRVSSLNPVTEGETMKKTEEEPMAPDERRRAREAERIGEIDWSSEEDTIPDVPAALIAGNVRKKEAGK